MENTRHIEEQVVVPEQSGGQRLDQVAAELFDSYSRSRLQAWIKTGDLRVDGKIARAKDKLWGGEKLELNTYIKEQGDWVAEPMDLDIVFEDEQLLVLDKPQGLVVHPAAGNPDGTLLNALLYHSPALAGVPRAGIVHRLDKDTTGLMMVAKTLEAHNSLVAQLHQRSVKRVYQAVVQGELTGGGCVNAPIGRHPRQRLKMAIVDIGGKEAITHYRLIKRFAHYTHIRLNLETGRTHQIRVHMAHIGHPLVGDPTYGGRFKTPPGAGANLVNALRDFPRQALHASELALEHPSSGQPLQWSVPLAKDIVELLGVIEGG